MSDVYIGRTLKTYALYRVVTLPVTLGDPPNLYVIAMNLIVLEGRFPIASLRTV